MTSARSRRGACQSSGKALTLYDPNTQSPFPGNRFRWRGSIRWLSKSRRTICRSPRRDRVRQGHLWHSARPATKTSSSARIDYMRNSKHTLYGRYFMAQYQNPAVFDGKNMLTTTQPGNLERAQSVTIGDTYTFGPGTLNSFHFTFNRRRDDRGPTDIADQSDVDGREHVQRRAELPAAYRHRRLQHLLRHLRAGPFQCESYQVADDVDVIRGKHQMAFGFNLVRVQNNTISGFKENGNFTFNGTLTGHRVAGMLELRARPGDFLIGRPNDFPQTNATPDDLRHLDHELLCPGHLPHLPPVHLELRGALGADVLATRTSMDAAPPSACPRSLPASSAKSIRMPRPECSSRATREFPTRCGTPRRRTSRRASGLVWNPHGDGRDTLRVGGAILYEVVETWFNERETTNAPIGTKSTRRIRWAASPIPGRAIPAGIHSPRTARRSSRPPAFTSTCRSIPSRLT